MKKLVIVAILLAGMSLSAKDDFKLRFTENFKGPEINKRLWSRIEGGMKGPDWIKYMSLREDLVYIKDGVVHLKGVVNDKLDEDERPLLTGGIDTCGKFSLKYGRVEVKCRLHGQRGAWPAIWMMPVKCPLGWPKDGEIDIVERLNNDDFVYQTVHSGWTQNHPNDPPRGGRGKIDRDDWNIYAIEWYPEKIVWKVNGKETFSYPKIGDDPMRYPWTTLFYLRIDMQLEGAWVGKADRSTLPVEMEVDWVKFYSLWRDGKQLTIWGR